MKHILPLLLLALVSCAVPRDTSRVAYYPHQPTAWRTTSGGHQRDAGPFDSVSKGFVTEDEIDAAVDEGYRKFYETFPDLKPGEHAVGLNDDYAMWVNGPGGGWASGVETTGLKMISVCLWSRVESAADPGAAFVVRPPGNYWGVNYSTWRSTARPLAPALMHELLHAAIGDPGHKDPRWSLVR